MQPNALALSALLTLLMLPAGHAATETPPRVSAQQFVDLQQGNNLFAGFRRAHAKGLCVSGEFRSNGKLCVGLLNQLLPQTLSPLQVMTRYSKK